MRRIAYILFLLIGFNSSIAAQIIESESLLFVYSLHGQTRRYSTVFQFNKDTLNVKWGIERNTKWQSGEYKILPEALKNGTRISYLQPIDKNNIILPNNETFAIISQDAYKSLKRKGEFIYNNTKFIHTSTKEKVECNQPLIYAKDAVEGCEMWILDNPSIPIIWKMKNNPIEINWEIKNSAENIFSIKEQIELMPEKSASTYYAYPAEKWQQTTPPEGFTPFYISHYGRHGSRWITDEERYTNVIAEFDNRQLTPLGEDVKRRLYTIYKDAKGNAGMLSPIGEMQHRDIAKRMYSNFPEVFKGNNISAYSTIKPRCIKSMNCFIDQLLVMNKKLNVKKSSDKKNMLFMAFDTEDMKKWESKEASWQKDFIEFQIKNIKTDRIISSLFKGKMDKETEYRIVMGLYWIASDMQDTTTGVSFYNIFTSDELFGIWKTINYRMYLCNGPAPLNKDIPAISAISLLKNILDCADKAIRNGKESATLRFGHDTNLLRLITLMNIKEYSKAEKNPEKYHEAWQDFNITPMAANMQMIFYKNNRNEILTKIMINEKEVHINDMKNSSPYYQWKDLYKYLSYRINQQASNTTYK